MAEEKQREVERVVDATDESTELARPAGLEEREISCEELTEEIANREKEINQFEAAGKQGRIERKRKDSLVELKELASLANQIQEIEARQQTEHSRKSVRNSKLDKSRLEPHRWQEPSPGRRKPSTLGIFQDRSGNSRRQTAVQEEKLTSEDKQRLNQLLTHVMRGEQDEAEALLKVHSDLVRYKGNVTDLSERTFKDITAFQYAWWARDYYMCQMMISKGNLAQEEAANQIREWEGQGAGQHGQLFSFETLDGAYQTYIDNYDNWGREQCEKHWCKVIGGAQRLLPAHVVQEYTTPDRPFYPVPDFTQTRCTRHSDRGHRWWFEERYSGGQLGDTWAGVRANGVRAFNQSMLLYAPLRIFYGAELKLFLRDQAAVQHLNKTRTTQLNSLRQELLEIQRQPTFDEPGKSKGRGEEPAIAAPA